MRDFFDNLRLALPTRGALFAFLSGAAGQTCLAVPLGLVTGWLVPQLIQPFGGLV